MFWSQKLKLAHRKSERPIAFLSHWLMLRSVGLSTRNFCGSNFSQDHVTFVVNLVAEMLIPLRENSSPSDVFLSLKIWQVRASR